MTQIRGAALPADLARTDASNTWTGTQDFTGATVLGIAGGSGGTVSGATPTTAGVIELAGDLAGTYTAPTVPALAGKADKAALAAVATSGAYTDLTGRPALAAVATSGAYTDLTGKPALAPVATSGAYADLSGRPALAAVATSGQYADLAGTPTVPTLYLRAKAAAGPTNTSTSSFTVDTDLQVASLPVGSYALDVFLAAGNGVTGAYVNFTGSATVTGSVTSNNSAGTNGGNLTAVQGTSGGTVPMSMTGVVQVTAAGSFALQYRSQASGSTATIGAGSWLRLTKVA